METTFNDYSWQGNRGAVGKQGLSGEPGAQVRQDSDFYLTRRIGHFWLGRVLLSINRCIILLQGQLGPLGENGEFGLTGEMVSKKKCSLPLWGCSPYFIKNVSACHLFGKPGNSGENSNGTVHPGGNFPEKSKRFRGITFFPFLPKRPKFSVPFVWITRARLQVERKRKIYRYFVNGTTQSRSCFRCQKKY